MPQLVWFITGCSSGLGQALALEAISRGDMVIATARNEKTLAPLAVKGATAMRLDITSDQETLNEIMGDAIAVHGRIDVLVNNAGYVLAGALEETSAERLREQFETNVFGPHKVTAALLPHFRERRAGTNVFISSLSGLVGHPLTGPYASSKFALEGMTESLCEETKPFGIRTLLIEPGRFRTLLLSESNRKNSRSAIGDYEDVTKKHFATLDAESENQPGEVSKGVSVIADLVRREGVAKGREVPFRLPLGTDCYEETKQKIDGMAKVMEEWKTVITSTDHAT